jgi:hypothetical protein
MGSCHANSQNRGGFSNHKRLLIFGNELLHLVMKRFRNISIVTFIVIGLLVVKLFLPKPSSESRIDLTDAATMKDSLSIIIKAYPEKIDTFCTLIIQKDPDLFNIIKMGFSKGMSIKTIDSAFHKDLDYIPYTIKNRILVTLEKASKE